MDICSTPADREPPAGPVTRRAGERWWTRALTTAERVAAPDARPSWVDLAEQAAAAAAPPHPAPADPLLAPLRPFLVIARDLISAGARDRLTARHVDAEAVADSWTAVLGGQLGDIATRTLAYETGRLAAPADGAAPASLTARLCTPSGLAAFFAEYPVLARLIGVATELAVEAGLELLDRFAADRATVVTELLGGADPGPVVAIEPGLGDRHGRGRTVAAISFADGRKAVYKPRDLAAYVAFGEIAGWLQWRVDAGIRVPAAVCRPGYGWLEFISAGPLPDRGSAAEFYRREGVLLATLYATHATDMHSENIIASGVAPVLVDVETLFHPALPIVRTTGDDPAAYSLASSVLRAGLLPSLIVDENGPSDWSGMGADHGALNRPRSGGEPVGPLDTRRRYWRGSGSATTR